MKSKKKFKFETFLSSFLKLLTNIWNNISNNDDNADIRKPVPINDPRVNEGGEYSPDPMLVLYKFEFSDGTILKFRENHSGDYWGDYPAAGWGQIVNPDGSTRGVDVNTIVRKGGLHRAKTPVTTLDHGKRMFWMADSEGNENVKRVNIFEDGWHPLVEGAVLATMDKLGI